MERDADEPRWRQWWRLGFATTLVLALVVGLYVSFRPSDFEDATRLTGGEEQTEPASAPSEPEEAEPVAEVTEEVTEVPTEDGLSEEEAQELIDAARAPEDTTVQVLDAGGGSSATSEAADVLTEMGYDVVAINSSRADYPVTTVLFTDGNEAEAQALRARDERFAEVDSNERLSEGVDVHVVVGPDWGD